MSYKNVQFDYDANLIELKSLEPGETVVDMETGKRYVIYGQLGETRSLEALHVDGLFVLGSPTDTRLQLKHHSCITPG